MRPRGWHLQNPQSFLLTRDEVIRQFKRRERGYQKKSPKRYANKD